MANRRNGFTLIELLLVVAMMGVLVTIATPHIAAALGGGRLRMGARAVVSAGRYARTMALLNQTPVDLTIELATGAIRIEAREAARVSGLGMSDLEALTNAVGYTDALVETSARRRASLAGGFGLAVSKQDREDWAWETGAEEDDGAALMAQRLAEIAEQSGEDTEAGGGAIPTASEVSFADSVNVERQLEGVRVKFLGYRDEVESYSVYARTFEDAGDRGARDEGSVTIRYRANGTVRPHVFHVMDAEEPGSMMTVRVNAVGSAKIEDGAEE